MDNYNSFRLANATECKRGEVILTEDNPPIEYEFAETLSLDEIEGIKKRCRLSGPLSYSNLSQGERAYIIRKEVQNAIKENPNLLQLTKDISCVLDEYYEPDQTFQDLVVRFFELKEIVKAYNNNYTEDGLAILKLFEKYFIKPIHKLKDEQISINKNKMDKAFAFSVGPNKEVSELVEQLAETRSAFEANQSLDLETIKERIHNIVAKAVDSGNK